MEDFKDILNQLKDIKGGLKTRPYILFYKEEKIKFQVKDIITGRVADKIIELSNKYPLNAFEQMTMDLHAFSISNPEDETFEFKKKYGYTSYQIKAFNSNDKDTLSRLDARETSIIDARNVLFKILIETIDYNDLNPDLWKLMNGKSKATAEFWQNQDLEMLKEIYLSFRSRIQ